MIITHRRVSPREREVATKFVKLIQFHPSKGVNLVADTPTGDPDTLLANSVANSSQHE